MKSILYVAAALMIGASIYGFVDYNETSRHKEFTNMYNESETEEPEVVKEEVLADDIIPAVKREQTEAMEKEVMKEEAKTELKKVVNTIVKKFKKKRTIDYESFSRAPLREEVVVEPVIKEVKIKEQ
jgi:excinuclease UvrABC helicase subunit UvrB